MHTYSTLDNCDFIIHPVGIFFKENGIFPYDILEETFFKIILHANDKLKCKSVAIPFTHGSTVYYSNTKWHIYFNRLHRAIQRFAFVRYDQKIHLKRILIVCANESIKNEAIKYFNRKIF